MEHMEFLARSNSRGLGRQRAISQGPEQSILRQSSKSGFVCNYARSKFVTALCCQLRASVSQWSPQGNVEPAPAVESPRSCRAPVAAL